MWCGNNVDDVTNLLIENKQNQSNRFKQTYKKKRWGYTILLDFAENLESKTARIANQHESEY
jgi:hypothetical protein